MRIDEFDVVVIGAGFAGAVAARKLAEESGKRVLVAEKRNTVAGNAYDYYNEDGILVHKYGPHIFHTDKDEVYDFLKRFGVLEPYELRVLSNIDGKFLPCPFNFTAVDTLNDPQRASILKERLHKAYAGKEQITVLEMLYSKDNLIREFAELLFEKDYRPYTMKQWGLTTEEVGADILERCKFYLSYEDRTNRNKYEFIPQKGYTSLIRQMLTYPTICVESGMDADNYLDIRGKRLYWNNEALQADVIYTGAIDGLFDWRYGELPYRSLHFEFRNIPQASFQEAPITVHPQENAYTRITEYTKLPVQEVGNRTCISLEYPVAYAREQEREEELQPYYPIVTEQNKALYERYLELAKSVERLYLCGRLAEYRYYDMDAVVESAFEVCERVRRQDHMGCGK